MAAEIAASADIRGAGDTAAEAVLCATGRRSRSHARSRRSVSVHTSRRSVGAPRSLDINGPIRACFAPLLSDRAGTCREAWTFSDRRPATRLLRRRPATAPPPATRLLRRRPATAPPPATRLLRRRPATAPPPATRRPHASRHPPPATHAGDRRIRPPPGTGTPGRRRAQSYGGAGVGLQFPPERQGPLGHLDIPRVVVARAEDPAMSPGSTAGMTERGRARAPVRRVPDAAGAGLCSARAGRRR